MKIQTLVSFAVRNFKQLALSKHRDEDSISIEELCVVLMMQSLSSDGELYAKSLEYLRSDDYKNFDFIFWGNIPSWSSEEAAYLALGLDPNASKYQDLDIEDRSNFERYKRAAERLSQHVEGCSAPEMYRYLLRFGATFDPRIGKIVLKCEKREDMYERKYRNVRKSQIVNATHRDTLYKIIYAYCNRPLMYVLGSNSKATSSIVKKIEDCGLSVTNKNVKLTLENVQARIEFLRSGEP
ncbi:hypothetical protein [Aquabacter sediminis]|uniref:hypothetical protein n=1 Tax=Aquabacter sediminis TaxID=3029197 RepID=UPI00237D678A|nr:hypothetical protein [Aquabacter sp. P-9]MDE1570484.1 hypothetical protein [Aquabacter sp. P-9]